MSFINCLFLTSNEYIFALSLILFFQFVLKEIRIQFFSDILTKSISFHKKKFLDYFSKEVDNFRLMNNDVIEKNHFKRREKIDCKKLFDFSDDRYVKNDEINNDCERLFNLNNKSEKLLQNKNFEQHDDDDDVRDNANKNQLFESIVSMSSFKLSNNQKSNIFIRFDLKNI